MKAQALAPVTTRDGERLALYQWEMQTAAEAPPPHALILIVHGLGEHARRYDPLAALLLSWGFAVRAYDQRGHGDSGGARGVIPHNAALLDDLADVIDALNPTEHPTAPGSPSPLPLILLGHSLGGLVVSRFVALKMRPVQGLILSSPALAIRLSALQKCLLAVALRLAPDWPVGNGVNARYLSHDEDVARNYQLDTKVHNRISARLAQFIASAGPATQAEAANWEVPTLLMYAGADRLVDAAGSRAFAQTAAATGVVTAKCFDGLYHEIFNEREVAPVWATLKSWLESIETKL